MNLGKQKNNNKEKGYHNCTSRRDHTNQRKKARSISPYKIWGIVKVQTPVGVHTFSSLQ